MSRSRDFETNSQFERQMNRALKLMLLYTYKVKNYILKRPYLRLLNVKYSNEFEEYNSISKNTDYSLLYYVFI